MRPDLSAFWSLADEELLRLLDATEAGLDEKEAQKRLKQYGANLLKPSKRLHSLSLLFSQFKSPIILLLIFAAILSFYLHEVTGASIILIIISISGLLGFWQERRAADAVAGLLSIIQIKASVLRDGEQKEVLTEYIVPGDIISLRAGDIVPGDCRILQSRDLFVNEATLTGETYPAEKMAGTLDQDTPLAGRINSLFMGTNVVSGTARAVVVHTGNDTELGSISQRLKVREPETEFERGVKHFGYLLLEVTMVLVVAIFAINVYLARPIIDSFLFSLALAVGLTPQLLPAIISINLAHGARQMASHKVIVKRLASIENFGSMNVLCTDKTGTLTEGTVRMRSVLDIEGKESDEVFLLSYVNAFFETGFDNPIDQAILSYGKPDISSFKKVDEVPYDFIRKRLSILVSTGSQHFIVTKGALINVLEVCTWARMAGKVLDISLVKEQIQARFQELSSQGFRVLGLAERVVQAGHLLARDEAEMTFLGFLVFFDPLKNGIGQTIHDLGELGIGLKIITGDNRLVATNISEQMGLLKGRILTGPEIGRESDEALQKLVLKVDVFAEVEPNQKERLILALRKSGCVVGYLGDGINDASALHAADIGLSVEGAVDVAKEAADIVLLEKDLGVLKQGVIEGRKTFSNTMKYVFMATSANFGNMFSMALLSLFLPFLPLLPTQVLLTNLLTDLPEMTIAGDRVDQELVARPRRWSIGFIRNFMVVFGLLSSIFDFLTFGALLFLLHANVDQFRTGWFIESVISASFIVLIIRTKRPFFSSRPSRSLMVVTVLVGLFTIILPFTPLSEPFGFTRISGYFLLAVAVIMVLYIASAELVKKIFNRMNMP
ncbi:MAG: magnesium-translocating P-type ATPase [Methanothrix sp.]|nr:magnesium-translocating P-type ATPase [Methanothrix sp.]OYV13111.1 MAG: magnesium-translocating P-type ATPase [Methanosaeta sp. ASO1]